VLAYGNLIEALESAPAARPFITSWVDEDTQENLTFGEFRRRSHAQASALQAKGAEYGDRVVIIMPQGIAAMSVFAGAMMLGSVPSFLAYPNEKVEPAKYRAGLAGVTTNLRAKLAVIDANFPDEMLECVSLSDGTILYRANEGERSAEECNSDVSIRSDQIAFIQHSAGTTGLQKGVALTHAAILRQLDNLVRVLEIDSEKDRIYSWLPLYHDMGLIACFILPMVCHLPVAMQSPIEWVMQPETMLGVITEQRSTLAWMPNFAFQFIPRRTRESRRSRYDLSSLRALINCSEPVRSSSMREFQNAFASCGLKAGVLQCSYAMAENVFAVSQSDVHGKPTDIWANGKQFRGMHRVELVAEGAEGAMSFSSSGSLLPDHEVRIMSEGSVVLKEGQVGEILVKSDCLFDGYYNRADLTAKAIVDGWYRTGDLGFLLEHELYVVGRKKDLIIIGGENLYPQDIEEIAGSHPAVHDGRVIALGVYNPELGTEQIVIVAEVETEQDLARAPEIEAEIRSRVVSGLGVAPGMIFLKPPKWIVKSTAGKAARSTTLEKLRKEHPELNIET
jgi:acyl-CoA synthetase (AMP-forming)/AMP-acid ligase II